MRDQFFGSMYSMVEASARAGGSARGTNFWVLYDKHGGDGPLTHPTLKPQIVCFSSRATNE